MPDLEILNTHFPKVAIVGRPNVGKSTLFNRIVGRRKAVVLDTPGVTRDRNFEFGEWNGRRFIIIDTGGYETTPRDKTFDQMREQSLMAIDEADVILFITDVKEPDNPVDLDVADILRRCRKPVILAVNKCDNSQRVTDALAFYSLGFESQYAISAQNGAGTGDMLDQIVDSFPPVSEEESGSIQTGIRIAVVGRQNVGKSSLVNAMLGYERVIANDLPGTTRDTIDTTFRHNEQTYTIVDTAGIRRRGKIERGIEQLSVFSAEASLTRCDVALILIDASQGLTEQDQHIAGYVHEAHRGCILLVNKWDLPEKDNSTAGAFVKKLRHEMGYISYAPIMMISAKTGQRVDKILGMVDKVYAEANKRLDTRGLNLWLQDTLVRLSPPTAKGRALRIKYVVQTGIRPPTFTFFVNDPKLMHFSYERYLMNRLREVFGFEGVPLRIHLRRKSIDRHLQEEIEGGGDED